MTIEQTIKKAIEGGYTPHTHKDKCDWSSVDHHVIDPKFWQCLGILQVESWIKLMSRFSGKGQKQWPGLRSLLKSY